MPRRLARLVAALVTLVVTLALGSACSGPAVVVRVAHSRGETVVPLRPARIVALGRQWIDTLSVLGTKPVGYLDDFATIAGSSAPWPNDVGSAESLDPGNDLTTQIAALKPDLILASTYASSEDEYKELSKIAPTLPNLTTLGSDSWSAQLNILGKILDKQALATRVTDRIDGAISAIAQKYPLLSSQTFLKVWVDSPTTVSVLDSPKDSPLHKIGMKGPEVFEKRLDNAYSIPLPLSRIGDLQSDILLVIGTEALQQTFRQAPGYNGLPAVTRKTLVFLDPITALAYNRQSALSIPYFLSKIDATLARANDYAAHHVGQTADVGRSGASSSPQPTR